MQEKQEKINALRNERVAAGLTVRKLANLSGVHFTTINELETGKRKAELVTLGKLAKALGVDWQRFIDLAKNQWAA